MFVFLFDPRYQPVVQWYPYIVNNLEILTERQDTQTTDRQKQKPFQMVFHLNSPFYSNQLDRRLHFSRLALQPFNSLGRRWQPPVCLIINRNIISFIDTHVVDRASNSLSTLVSGYNAFFYFSLDQHILILEYWMFSLPSLLSRSPQLNGCLWFDFLLSTLL